MLINQQTHQLRDRQYRVGIIQVNRGFLRQIGVGFVELVMAAQNILNGCRHQEVLLTQAQLPARIGRVIRIEHARYVFGVVFIFHRRKIVTLVKFTQVDFATRLRIPQPQGVGRIGIVARNNLVVGHGQNLFGLQPVRLFAFLLHAPAKTHFVAGVMAFEFPWVTVFQPVIRGLFLPAINNVLLEHAVVVANTITASGQRQRCQRIQEAGRKTP